MRFRLLLLLVSTLILAMASSAQNRQRGGPGPGNPANATSENASQSNSANPANQPFPAPPAVEKLERTQHSITVNGKTLAYTATAGTLVIEKDDGKPLASMFFVGYTRDDAIDKSKRPVTFTFNGGPGSSSVWLHMGALGPRRVAMGPGGEQPPPPYHLVDNEDTPLEFTDLVFIDPVSTGFSRNAPGENPQQFHGLEGDLDSVAEFIRLYTTKFDRWASPKFLAGESYGTTRAAGLSQVLLHKGIYLNGITLISSVLNFETISFAPGNELPYILYLPTYTATAWYHKKLTGDLQSGSVEQAVQASRQFAGGEYTLALMKGDKLSSAERTKVAQQVARLTGLSPDYIERANLRVSIQRFAKELLRKEGRTVGRYDSRLEGTDTDAAGERPEFDPSYSSVLGAYTALFNDYVRTQLKFESSLPYEILTNKVQPWSYSRQQNQYVNTAEMLRQAMEQNPSLHVLVANGYYDMATPFFATEYTMNHLGGDSSLSNNITLTYCEAGHMLYTRKSCLDALHKSMADLYQRTLGGAQSAGTR